MQHTFYINQILNIMHFHKTNQLLHGPLNRNIFILQSDHLIYKMPLTRRNVVQSSSPAKKARTSRTGTPKEGEPENPKETLGGKAENGSNMGVNPDEMVSRRSGRQRTVSKRLQDMHIDFGPKKSALKRQREGTLPSNYFYFKDLC